MPCTSYFQEETEDDTAAETGSILAPTPVKHLASFEVAQKSNGSIKTQKLGSDLHGNHQQDRSLDELTRVLGMSGEAGLNNEASSGFAPGQPGLDSKMIDFEPVWRAYPYSQCLSIKEAIRTRLHCEMLANEPEKMKDIEIMDLAVGIYKLLADPSWNFENYEKSVQEIFLLTRSAQTNPAENTSTQLQDTGYLSGLSMTWNDENTVSALNAASLYYRYRPVMKTVSVKLASTFVIGYLTALLRIKIIIERNNQAALRRGDKGSANSKREHNCQSISAQDSEAEKSSQATAEGAGCKGSPGQEILAPKGSSGSCADSAKEESQPPSTVKKGRRGVRMSHPQHVIDNTVDWLRSTRDIDSNLQRYHKSLCDMWTSGKFEWTREQPVPSQTQVYYWVRSSRRERPPAVPLSKVSAKKRAAEAQQAMKRLVTVLRARQLDYRGITPGQMALSKAFERVALLLYLYNDLRPVLLLAQVSVKFNSRMVKMELYSSVRRIVQGRNIDIDAQSVLKQMGYAERRPNAALTIEASIPAKQASSIQLDVDFSRLPVSGQVHALSRFKGDYRDTIINLGDALNSKKLVFVWEGGFGSVFAFPEKRVVLKVMKRPVTLEQAAKDVANEAAAFHLTTTLSRIASGGMASRGRGRAVPFAPLPATEVCGSTSGAMALPSWGMCSSHGLYYPALIMQMASSTIDQESCALSKSFFSDPMGVVSAEGFVRLASLIRLIAEPLAAMHSLNSAHRDLKEDNILFLRVAHSVQGYIHFNMEGKKVTGRLGDCSKALYFGVEYHIDMDDSTHKHDPAISESAIERPCHSLADPSLPNSCDMEMKPPADMAGKAGTVPLAIPMSAVHQQVPVAPSTQVTKGASEPAVIKRKAPLYSGTLTYTPPEAMPKFAEGAQFLTARDYQPGDMWALGIVLANVLGGSGVRQAHIGSHDKKIFAQAEDCVIWTKLNKLPAALHKQSVPSQWTDVMDLLRSLTREDPAERMTAKDVLEHPFLKQAEKIWGLYA